VGAIRDCVPVSQIIAFATAGEWRLISLKAVVDLAA
jgi:hypothetical protein